MAQCRSRLTAKDLNIVTIQVHGEAPTKTRATSERVPADVVNLAAVALCTNAEHDASDRSGRIHRLDVAIGLEERFLVIDVEGDRLGDGGHFAVDIALSATSLAVADDTQVRGLLAPTAVASHSLEDHAFNLLQRLLLPLEQLGLRGPELLRRFEVLGSWVLSRGRGQGTTKKAVFRALLRSLSAVRRRRMNGGHALAAVQLRRGDNHIIRALGRAQRRRAPGALLHAKRRVVKARGSTWVIGVLATCKSGGDPSSVGVGSEVALTRRSRLGHRDGNSPAVVQTRIEVNEEEGRSAGVVWDMKVKGG